MALTELALHHRRAGSGEPLVAIHGIGSTWRVWEPVLGALEARHDVLALSLPGYGGSPPLAEEPNVPALVEAVEEAMDAVGFQTAHLVGNSLGGWIAAELAARGRARSVVAISPAGLWTSRELEYSAAVLRFSYAAAQRLAPHADVLAASALGRRLLFGYVCARGHRIDPRSAAHQVRALACSPSFPRTLRWIHEGRRMPARLDRIGCPFRTAWGTRDLLLPPRQGLRWRRIVPESELVVLPGLGHVPMPDDRRMVARTVLDFCARPRPARRAAAPA